MKMRLPWVGTWLLGTLLAASATEYTVTSALDDGGEGTLRTLVANAASGDSIVIPEGMVVALNSVIAITVPVELSIAGQGAGATLYGNRDSESFTNGMFYVNHSGANLTFDNLAVTNGYSAGSGGAFYIYNCSNATTFVRCRFLGNQAVSVGGVMYLMQKINLNDCAFTNNNAGNAGGCFYLAMDSQYAQNITRSGVLVSTNCDFFGNSAVSAGGISSASEQSRWASLDIDGWNCVSNFASQAGCFNILTTNMIRNCVLEGNYITGGMGSVAHLYRGSGTVFKGCIFRNNKATNTGAIVSRGNTSFFDCVFDGNFAAGGATVDSWRTSSTLYAYLDYSSGTYVISNCVFKNNPGQILSTSQGTENYLVNISDSSFFDPVGLSTDISIAHGGSIERCFFGIGDVNPSRDTVLLSVSTASTRTNAIVNCTFSRNPATSYSYKRKALNISNTTGNYRVGFCSFVGFAGSEGAVKLSSSTASSTMFKGCVFAENGQRTSGVLTNPVDIYNAALGVGNCCFMMAESKLTTLAEGTYTDNQFETDPKLRGLADNDGHILPDGAYLQTYAFMPSSSLRNRGGATDAPDTDARGMRRDATPDIGAYEYIAHYGTMVTIH